MPRPLTSTLKAKIRALHAAGASYRQIAAECDCSVGSVFRTVRATPSDAPVSPRPEPVQPTVIAITLNAQGALPELSGEAPVNPGVRRLFELVRAEGAADELDVLIVAFKLPAPRCRSYLNVTSAELLRARFDVDHGEGQTSSLAPERPAVPAALWRHGVARLVEAFRAQETERHAVRARLLASLPTEQEH